MCGWNVLWNVLRELAPPLLRSRIADVVYLRPGSYGCWTIPSH